MAKNKSSLRIGDKNFTASDATRGLNDWWVDKSDGVVQSVSFYASAAAEGCAKDLLAYANEEVPIGNESGGATKERKYYGLGEKVNDDGSRKKFEDGFGTEAYYARAKELNINAKTHETSGDYIQFTKPNGQKGVRNIISKNEAGERIYDHSAGALLESGRVDTLQDEYGKHDKKIGYKVSYDTRRTDPRSLVNNFNYAIIQHEMTGYNHPNGGKEKFLQDPYQLHKEEFLDRLASAVKQGVEEGGGQ